MFSIETPWYPSENYFAKRCLEKNRISFENKTKHHPNKLFLSFFSINIDENANDSSFLHSRSRFDLIAIKNMFVLFSLFFRLRSINHDMKSINGYLHVQQNNSDGNSMYFGDFQEILTCSVHKHVRQGH